MPLAFSLYAVVVLTVGGSAYGRQSDARVAPLLTNLGTLHHPITTDSERANRFLEEAALIQDGLRYSEPQPWHQPVRQVLGAVLLEAGRPEEAEVVYRKDLKWNRENGWSLYGLLQALRAQGKTSEAAEVQEEFEDAWAPADVALTASRF